MLYKTLQRNEVIALVMDRPSGDNGVEVTFFGEKASLPAGPAAMSLRTGAKIIPGYCIVQPDRTVVGGMLPPIDYQPTGDRERDVQAITQMLATAMEECIRQYPDQWYMFRQMWPNGTSEKAHKC
jgi:KDO2-lipid IV(A) lauroyltransferase